jgi:hypothetical protein
LILLAMFALLAGCGGKADERPLSATEVMQAFQERGVEVERDPLGPNDRFVLIVSVQDDPEAETTVWPSVDVAASELRQDTSSPDGWVYERRANVIFAYRKQAGSPGLAVMQQVIADIQTKAAGS